MKKTYIEPEFEYIDILSGDFLSFSTDTEAEITDDVKPIW